MADLILSNLDSSMLDQLNARAALHGRSLEIEVKAILQEAATEANCDAWTGVDQLRQYFADSGRQFCDSVELLREDRER